MRVRLKEKEEPQGENEERRERRETSSKRNRSGARSERPCTPTSLTVVDMIPRGDKIRPVRALGKWTRKMCNLRLVLFSINRIEAFRHLLSARFFSIKLHKAKRDSFR